MTLLAANNRLQEVSRVAETFGSLVAHSRGQVTAVVTTADPLSAEEAEEIRRGLSEVLPKGKTLQLSTKVDASIVGGVVVDIGDKHIDLSIASRVKQVEQLIAAGSEPDQALRVHQLLRRAEFKRRQAAPTLKVSGRAFGGGWRMPIAAA